MYTITFNMRLFLVLSVAICSVVSASDLQGFDDNNLFKITWKGNIEEELEPDLYTDIESMTVRTNKNERYKCIIPKPQHISKSSFEDYDGPNALEIIEPLFSQSSCTYRLESYWTYEICHGRHVRQYHEDRDSTKSRIQEYYLGRWDKAAQDKLDKELDSGMHYPPPIKKLDGLSLPYLQMNFTDGTLCDIGGLPRSTSVLYVCYAMGKHDIFSLKETSTCQYELIVLSAILCKHPHYVPQDSGEASIDCMGIGKTPKKPRSLRQMEKESMKLRHQRFLDDERFKKVFAVFSVDSVAKDGDGTVRLELRSNVEGAEDKDSASTKAGGEHAITSAMKDVSPVKNFLSGVDCLQGGSGWWRFEFCYGRYVEQYHIEQDHSRTVMKLGVFDRAAHIEWITKNPSRRPKPVDERKFISHFYGGGSFCEKTGKQRETEVRLRCVERNSAGAVSLYLIEPNVCQYILGVESPLVCPMLKNVDEYGLLEETEEVTVLDDDENIPILRDEL